MSSTAHQSAIHWLTAHRPADLTGQRQVDALIRYHEAACVAEEGDAPACSPCQYQHRCLCGDGCPIRNLEAGKA